MKLSTAQIKGVAIKKTSDNAQAMIEALLDYVEHKADEDCLAMIEAVRENLQERIESLMSHHGYNPIIRFMSFIHRVRTDENLPALLMDLAEKFIEHRTQVAGKLPDAAIAEWHAVLAAHAHTPETKVITAPPIEPMMSTEPLSSMPLT